MRNDELKRLEKEFFQLTPDERADIARAILEGAVRHARRRKKAAMWTLPAG